MKILILAEDYPDLEGKISLFYIHTRSLHYLKKGIDVEVISFRAKYDYNIDGVNVIRLDTYKNRKQTKYDLLILHAPNLKNHYIFLKKYGKNFDKHIFFFHGHEVLKINKDYSKPYKYMDKKIKVFRNVYDFLKLKIWHNYFIKNNSKSYYIFVSKWMKEMFLKNIKIKENLIDGRSYITYNSVGEIFETETYNKLENKEFDFITVRGCIDGSKYSIDIINNLAYNNPNCKFLVIGKGKYFNIYTKASNIIWIQKHCNHEEIVKYLNKSKCALMPTRTDAQGLMACEMATFGIPLLSSNIPVCHEIFDDFDNVELIDNTNQQIDLEEVLEKLEKGYPYKKNTKYYNKNTSEKEIEIFIKVLKEKK